MRIVAGVHRGRQIVAPKGHSTRPTADRTRQAVFNMLEHASWGRALADARVIDLFAGSGALGLEALSRGASTCLFVDHDAAARAAIQHNLDALKMAALGEIQAWDATRPRASNAGRFGLAFIAPPYGKGLVIPALASMRDGGWLATGAIISVESNSEAPPVQAPRFERLETRSWGASSVTFLRYLGPQGA